MGHFEDKPSRLNEEKSDEQYHEVTALFGRRKAAQLNVAPSSSSPRSFEEMTSTNEDTAQSKRKTPLNQAEHMVSRVSSHTSIQEMVPLDQADTVSNKAQSKIGTPLNQTEHIISRASSHVSLQEVTLGQKAPVLNTLQANIDTPFHPDFILLAIGSSLLVASLVVIGLCAASLVGSLSLGGVVTISCILGASVLKAGLGGGLMYGSFFNKQIESSDENLNPSSKNLNF